MNFNTLKYKYLLPLLSLLSACSPVLGIGGKEIVSESVQLVRSYEPKKINPVLPEKASLSFDEKSEFAQIGLSKFNSYPLHSEDINAFAVTSDTLVTYTGADDGVVYRNSLQADGTLLATKLIQADKPIFALAVSPDNLKLAISVHSEVLIYDLGRGEFVNHLTRVKGRITNLQWDPRGELLAMGLTNGDVYIWNLVEGLDAGLDSERAIELYRSQPYPVVGLAFHPRGRLLIVAHKSAKVFIWRIIRTDFEMGLRDANARIDDLLVGKKQQELAVAGGVEAISLSDDGSELYVGCGDGRVRHYKLRGLVGVEEIVAGNKRQNSVSAIHFEQDNLNVLVAASRDKRIRFWCFKERQAQLIAQSLIFDEAVSILGAKESRQDLWAVQKSGNLLHFSAKSLSDSKEMRQNLSLCQ